MGSALPTPLPTSEWHASLALRFARRPNGCRLIEANKEGPLAVQRPFYPEGPDTAHCYLLHPPGGLVSGDLLRIEARCEDNSHALITTPGAGRAYRARESGTLQRQQQVFRLSQNAQFEWLPMETIVYPGANLHSETDVYLDDDSTLIAWDVICLGLPASGEAFEKGCFRQRTRIFQNDKLELLDRFALTAPSPLQTQPVGLNGNTVLGLMLAGPFTEAQATPLIDALRERELPLAITRVRQWLLLRYLGHSAFDARRAYNHCWGLIRPALNQRPACPPRIWAT